MLMSAQTNMLSRATTQLLNQTFKAYLAVSSQTAHVFTDITKFASATRGKQLIEKKSEKPPY